MVRDRLLAIGSLTAQLHKLESPKTPPEISASVQTEIP